MKKVLVLLFAFSAYLFSANIDFTYKKAFLKSDKTNKQLIESSKRISEFQTLLEDLFLVKEDIKIIFGAQDGPYFDPNDNTIAIPYSFLEETKEKFEKANYHKKENIDLNTAVIDVLIHTILHELGHALVNMYDIPILGREEDAVDNFANIILIDFLKFGDDILLTNADIFDLYANEKKVFTEEDFMGEHSLDLQRFYSMLCFVYASNPKKYEKMLNTYEFPEYRKDMCISDLDRISKSWYEVLKKFMRL